MNINIDNDMYNRSFVHCLIQSYLVTFFSWETDKPKYDVYEEMILVAFLDFIKTNRLNP